MDSPRRMLPGARNNKTWRGYNCHGGITFCSHLTLGAVHLGGKVTEVHLSPSDRAAIVGTNGVVIYPVGQTSETTSNRGLPQPLA